MVLHALITGVQHRKAILFCLAQKQPVFELLPAEAGSGDCLTGQEAMSQQGRLSRRLLLLLPLLNLPRSVYCCFPVWQSWFSPAPAAPSRRKLTKL